VRSCFRPTAPGAGGGRAGHAQLARLPDTPSDDVPITTGTRQTSARQRDRQPGDGVADGGGVQDQVGRLWFDMAGTPFPRQIPALVEAVGSDRILYGSDYCWTPAAAALAQIASVDAAEQPANNTWRALTSRNGARLLPELLGSRK
jgi:Amidohydrolase